MSALSYFPVSGCSYYRIALGWELDIYAMDTFSEIFQAHCICWHLNNPNNLIDLVDLESPWNDLEPRWNDLGCLCLWLQSTAKLKHAPISRVPWQASQSFLTRFNFQLSRRLLLTHALPVRQFFLPQLRNGNKTGQQQFVKPHHHLPKAASLLLCLPSAKSDLPPREDSPNTLGVPRLSLTLNSCPLNISCPLTSSVESMPP